MFKSCILLIWASDPRHSHILKSSRGIVELFTHALKINDNVPWNGFEKSFSSRPSYYSTKRRNTQRSKIINNTLKFMTILGLWDMHFYAVAVWFSCHEPFCSIPFYSRTQPQPTAFEDISWQDRIVLIVGTLIFNFSLFYYHSLHDRTLERHLMRILTFA